MAKVMISLPDELLERVDLEAARSRTSRSAVLREFARAALDERSARLATRLGELNRRSRGHGGDVVAKLKAERPPS